MLLRVLLAAGALAASISCVSAQTYTLPQIGLAKDSGTCQPFAVQERSTKAMVPIGCVSPKGWSFKADNFKAVGVGTLDDEFHATPNPDAVQISPGMGIGFCPGLACIPGLTDRNQRASMVVSGTSKLDGEAEEQLLALSLTSKTGALTNWSANAAYTTNQNVYFNEGDNVFRVLNNCTSGGTGPVLPDQNNPKGAVVTNGSCQMKWINRGAIAAKLTAYFENEVEAGSANAWTQANNFILRPGAPTHFNINTEMDFSNYSKDCALGEYCTALRIGMGGNKKSTQAIDITTDTFPNDKVIWGIRFNGKNLASDALVALDSNTKYGIAANQLGLGGDTFTGGLILDNSVSPASLIITNQKTQASIIDQSPGSGATLVTSNTRNGFDLGLGATAPIGIALNGTYGNAAIDSRSANITPQAGAPTTLVMASGQQACWAGFNVCWRYDPSAQRMKLRWNNQDIVSIDSNGNFRSLGTFTTGTP